MAESGARRKNVNRNGNYNGEHSKKFPAKNYTQNSRNFSEGRVNQSHKSEKPKFHSRKPRQYPIGKKELQILLEKESYIIAVSLLNENSGYNLLLDVLNISDDTLSLLIKVLHKSLCNKVFANGINDLLLLTLTNSKFLLNLNKFISDNKYEVKNIADYLPLICEIIETFLTMSPVNAFPVASGIVDTCMGVIQHLKQEDQSLANNIEDLLQTLQLKIKESRASYVKFKNKGKETPPDDFRELDIVPTSVELNAVARPFLRENIIKGSYESSEHYLDIQFRLLKEDFMRPLREGLKQYRNDYSKNSDVRIYSNFTLHSNDIEKTEFVYFFRINSKRKFISNSKRFMFGNIVCISEDNFHTVITASVFNTDRLLENLVGLKLETESAMVHYGKRYIAIESKAYFVSYKHTLKALQNVKEVPFEEYIVFVKDSEKEPEYILKHQTKFIINKDALEMNDTDMPSFIQTDAIELHDADMPSFIRTGLLRVNSQDSLHSSNSSYENLQIKPTLFSFISSPNLINLSAYSVFMDESQKRALYSALTCRVAIIQGPPGTGKTFLGLQITKFLLRHKMLWNENDSHPILVVCYTNHALDQFLEGMLEFTDSIIRVGSRSKSEKLQSYEIKHCVFKSKGRRDDDEISNAFHDCRLKIKECSERLKKIAYLSSIVGESIVDFDSFSQFNILPIHITKAKFDMVYFLREKFIYDRSNQNQVEIRANSENQNSQKVIGPTENNNSLDNPVLSAEEELIQQEENERMLDDQDDEILENEHDSEYNSDYEDENERAYNHSGDESETCDDRLPYIKTLLSYRQLHKMEDDIYNSEEISFQEKREINKDILIWNQMLGKVNKSKVFESECINLERTQNYAILNFNERAKLYCYWRDKLRLQFETLKLKAEKKYMSLHGKLISLRTLTYLNHMKKTAIVGMTTTGAAQYCELLHDLAPPIVIVEEAAEIFEAHVISSLSSRCQHLIMIGDHQQLRPKPTTYELGKKYNLDTSLFERLINNGIKYETLEYQHRMKPLISDLLVPTFYENLKDHPSVLKHPKIRGVKEDLFFINHSQHESQPLSDNESYENLHEASFLLGLCRHLIYQGYSENDITVITPYSGQFRCLRMLQKNEDLVKNIPISILDNFQGEESNIILLSLVRSNEEEKIGFMKIDNRICVAISRAKHGMYIIGNMNQMMKSSSIWSKINEKLIEKKLIGYSLRLSCRIHPEDNVTVNNYEDFAVESPEGGCNKKCSEIFPNCGHACPRYCHPDDSDHIKNLCKTPCPKYLCEFNHTKCPNLCHEDCPNCIATVEKKLACGHNILMKCCSDPNEIICTVLIDKLLPCNHLTKNVCCHVNVTNFPCYELCLKMFDCGHSCRKKCHKSRCKQHYLNVKLCSLESCFEDGYDECPDCRILTKKMLDCGHKHLVRCNFDLKAFKCLTLVDRVLPCDHVVKNIKCSVDVNKLSCRNRCCKLLSCGHKCKKRCHKSRCKKHYQNEIFCSSESCFNEEYDMCPDCPALVEKELACGHKHEMACSMNPNDFKCHIKVDQKLPCGHNINIECFTDISFVDCPLPCGKTLTCGHKCDISCHYNNDPNHEKDLFTCTEECTKFPVNCDLHRCRKLCHEQCGTCIKFVNWKLPCGHVMHDLCGKTIDQIKCSGDCQRILPCGHPCPKTCSEICGGCKVLISKIKENCGHTVNNVPCDAADEEMRCQEQCSNVLPCSHPCPKLCSEDCEECTVHVEKIIPECLHSISVKCGDTVSIRNCRNPCKKMLPCAHKCQERCKDLCTKLCTTLVASDKLLCPRGHGKKEACYKYLNSITPSVSLLDDYYNENCKEKCGLILDCGHECRGKCGRCFSGRLHTPCTDQCSKLLPCGHRCQSICSIECPPCQEVCLWKCDHMTCSKMCGDSCFSCKEKCPSFCKHSFCSEKCGAWCKRRPCGAPCELKITKCNHPCVGFCGEPCPLLCRVCDEEQLQELLFDDMKITFADARFIVLKDCGHVFESNFLDKFMYTTASKMNADHGVKMKMCPECHVPIYNTRRYRYRILDIYNDVLKRNRMTNNRRVNQEWFRSELLGILAAYPDEVMLLKENLQFDHNFSISSKAKYIKSSLLDLYAFQVNFLKFAAKMKAKSEHKTELQYLINLAMTYKGKVTSEKRELFFCEIRRLKNFDSLSSLKGKNYIYLRCQEIITNIETLMNPTLIFNKETENQVRKLLDDGWKLIRPNAGRRVNNNYRANRRPYNRGGFYVRY